MLIKLMNEEDRRSIKRYKFINLDRKMTYFKKKF